MSDSFTSPKVSVVCSAFNSEDHLHRALDSVLAQQGVRFELIVVNDGSVDATPIILNKYAIADSRIRIIHQNNQGLTKALITGCAEARGKYIARLDSDDTCLPGRLQKQSELLDLHPDVSFVSCWSRAIGPGDETLFETTRPADVDEASEMLRNHRQGPTAHGSVMFRRDSYQAVGGYRPQFYFAQDSDLWLRLIEVGKIAYVPEILYQFHVGRSNISSNFRQVQHALGELAHACKNARHQGRSEGPFLEQASSIRPGRTNLLRSDLVAGDYFIGSCLLKRRDQRAARYLVAVLRKCPWMLRAWAALALCGLSSFGIRRAASEQASD